MFDLARLRPFAAFGLAAMALFAQPSLAQPSGAARYTAELAQPAAKASFAAGGVVWRCEGTSCVAPVSTARPLRICTALRREAGAVSSFAVEGTTLEPAQLERCNG